MTNAQKWVAAFLLIFVALFILSKISPIGSTSSDDIDYYNAADAEETGPESDPAALIQKNDCVSCHGGNLQGTINGPSLIGVNRYWSRNDLINYIRNPLAYGTGERFDTYRKKYVKSEMPPFGNLNIKDLGRIADYLLSLE